MQDSDSPFQYGVYHRFSNPPSHTAVSNTEHTHTLPSIRETPPVYPSNATGSYQVKTDNFKITGNKNIVQYYGATKTYKIRLLNNNQPVKNEIITVKIGKNTVKVKTNNQGYATLKLNLKAGKYTITSTYKNVKVSNKITVKPTLITKNKKNQERKNINLYCKAFKQKRQSTEKQENHLQNKKTKSTG